MTGSSYRFPAAAIFRMHRRENSGRIELIADVDDYIRQTGLGPDAMSRSLDFSSFKKALSKAKRSTVKAALMDQSLIAGIGNVYSDEIMYQSNIHPSRKMSPDRRNDDEAALYKNKACSAESHRIQGRPPQIPRILDHSLPEKQTKICRMRGPHRKHKSVRQNILLLSAVAEDLIAVRRESVRRKAYQHQSS